MRCRPPAAIHEDLTVNEPDPPHDQEVDIRGMCCAQPIIRLAARIKPLQPGAVTLALADKESMRKDIPAFCKQTGHQLLATRERDGQLLFWIRKS
jgi:tRNA 2-thiouridine synthesizing protein A